MKSLENGTPEPALPGLEQFTSEQMFFVSNAQVILGVVSDIYSGREANGV